MNQTSDNSVSVVMPCYNGLPYLSVALDSALAQTHRPVQIIVVDDGSKDESAALVREYAQRHPDRGIELIQQANAGEPAARNAGIHAATGEWIAMLDTDDWWEPNKLARQLLAARDAGHECVLVHTGVVGHLPDGREERKSFEGASRRTGWCTLALLEPFSIGHPSIMVRRDALTKIDGYDPTFKQACDIDLYFRLSAIGSFAFVPEYLLHYRYHAKQMSGSQMDQIRFHHRAIDKFFAEHPDFERRVSTDAIKSGMAQHVAVKLQSLYWRRNLTDFRALLDYAQEKHLDNHAIRAWRRRAIWPDWMIRFKDRFTGKTQGGAA